MGDSFPVSAPRTYISNQRSTTKKLETEIERKTFQFDLPLIGNGCFLQKYSFTQDKLELCGFDSEIGRVDIKIYNKEEGLLASNAQNSSLQTSSAAVTKGRSAADHTQIWTHGSTKVWIFTKRTAIHVPDEGDRWRILKIWSSRVVDQDEHGKAVKIARKRMSCTDEQTVSYHSQTGTL